MPAVQFPMLGTLLGATRLSLSPTPRLKAPARHASNQRARVVKSDLFMVTCSIWELIHPLSLDCTDLRDDNSLLPTQVLICENLRNLWIPPPADQPLAEKTAPHRPIILSSNDFVIISCRIVPSSTRRSSCFQCLEPFFPMLNHFLAVVILFPTKLPLSAIASFWEYKKHFRLRLRYLSLRFRGKPGGATLSSLPRSVGVITLSSSVRPVPFDKFTS
ncbi:hypothetical protein PDESU_02510 [Pontiella desulfatans]|uniref:Uncharacterized protein n=1 Tax=Pontiella desulfatans TaxID=2750659 RepID=A0A6C2U233_PONDE|nr:hypothetical protein PDESU_02510 [Pontiella desulfatans]